MTHLTVREYRSVGIGSGKEQFTEAQARALHDAAIAHPLAHDGGGNILAYGRDTLTARQMVGVIAASGADGPCSLEILPKVDPDAADEDAPTVRLKLVQMLDVALGLQLDLGHDTAAIAREADTLLEILIRHFADRLLAETRRGLPRRYLQHADDLPALRGRLDVTRQFTVNAVRPDRLACRFDELSADTPLMRIMAAAIVCLRKHARHADTQRKLDELRHAFAGVTAVPVRRLPWKEVRIDRTNRRWQSLHDLAKLLLESDYQQTHHDAAASQGLTLLFPMNDLFEKYVAALLRRALAGTDFEVVEQGAGRRRNCLTASPHEHAAPYRGDVFLTKPDILLCSGSEILAIVDTKWKPLADRDARKCGMAEADLYQMMAYARIYRCSQQMLLYPEMPGAEGGVATTFGMAGGDELLHLGTLDIARKPREVAEQLRSLVEKLMEPAAKGSQESVVLAMRSHQ